MQKTLSFCFFILIASILSAQNLPSDTVKNPKPVGKLTAQFDSVEILIQDGEVFSKNMRVVSNVDVPFSFKVDITFPAEWKSLVNPNKKYTIDPHDTLYVPLHLVPLGKIKGNTKYMITAFLFDTIGSPITSAYVNAARPKFTKWSLNLGPYKKIYFKNDSSTARFTINVGNEGTETQDLYLSMGNLRKDVIILDTAGRIIKKPSYTFSLKQFSDTTFHFGVKIFSASRNMKRVDSDGYRPGGPGESRSYAIFVKTMETSLFGSLARQISDRLSFVKLPNETRISDYGMYSLPMTMDLTFSNLFSDELLTNLHLYGATKLDDGANIFYNAQFMTAFNTLGSSVFPSPFLTLGYSNYRMSIMIGDVGGGAGGIGFGGKGITGQYMLSKRHRVGAFFVMNPGFLNRITYIGFGANYNYTGEKFTGGVSYAHLENMGNLNGAVNSDYLSFQGSYTIASTQGVSLSVILVNNVQGSIANQGYNVSAGYHGGFIRQKLQVNLSGSFFSSYYSFYDQGNRGMVNLNSSYRFKKSWYLRMNNSFNQYAATEPVPTLIFYSQQSLNNQISVSRSMDIHSSFTAGFFFNVFRDDYYDYTSVSRGINLGLNYSLPESYLIFSTNTMMGFTQITSAPDYPNNFFINLFTLLKYRVFSLNVRYSNGNPSGININTTSSNLYSEDLAITLNHQYQFRNRRFILNNSITYNLMPEIQRNSFGITPELNYYSLNGWRIRLTAGYYFSESAPLNYTSFQSLVPSSSDNSSASTAPIVSTSYLLMLGVHKDFGIPLPFIKRRYPSLNFIAFVDINGNGKFDYDETRLENVVINVNGWEVMTNSKGEAQLKNMPEGDYVWQAFCLDDLKGFFPNISDKIKVFAPPEDSVRSRFFDPGKVVAVPFVKGIRLFGKVYADREKLSPDALTALDLSGIRISVNCQGKKSATLTESDGSFSFYLPYGSYILTMDEKVLGDQFRVLQNDIDLTLNKGVENMFVSFYIVENQRKIIRKHFDANGNLISEESEAVKPAGSGGATGSSGTSNIPGGNNAAFSGIAAGNIPGGGSGAAGPGLVTANGAGTGSGSANGSGSGASAGAGKDLIAEANAAANKKPRPKNDVSKDAFLADKTDATTTKGLIYTVQLGALVKPLDPVIFKGLKNLMYERIDNQMVRITAGNMGTEAEALAERDNLSRVGFPGAFVSVYYDGKNISLSEARQIKKNSTH